MDVARALPRRLAAWGLLSTAGGLLAARRGRDAEQRAFGRQSVAWGAVDLGIAAMGLTASRRGKQPPSARRLRRILLVNAAADVGYVAVGAHLAAPPEIHRGTPLASP